MKSRFIVALSFLSTGFMLASASVAQAGMLIKENIDFSAQRPSPLMVASAQTPMMMKGQLQSKADSEDIIRFTGSHRTQQLKMQIRSQAAVRYEIYEDANRNGRADAAERRISRNGTTVTLPANKQYLMKVMRRGSGTSQKISYTIQFNGQ